MKRDLVRVNCNLPPRLVEEVDKYAAQLSLSRTTAMIVLLSDALASRLRKED